MGGRVVLVKAEISDSIFWFVNIYSPNVGSEHLEVSRKLREHLVLCDQSACIVLGGDWNCTVDFNVDRTSEEPLDRLVSRLDKVSVKWEVPECRGGVDSAAHYGVRGTGTPWPSWCAIVDSGGGVRGC